VIQDYRQLSDDQIEAIEKQCLRTVVQAMQEYSREARGLFETTQASSETEVIVLAEDIVQYALEVAECYPIDRRFAGFIDYKRIRWVSAPFGITPQAFLVDAKASTENNRDTLQQSQLPMDAQYVRNSQSGPTVESMNAGVPPHVEFQGESGTLFAMSTSVLIHFYYENLRSQDPPFRDLKAIYVLVLPHARLKHIYNPTPQIGFFGAGKHSPSRGEVPRIRVYFDRLRAMCSWRLQELLYVHGQSYSQPIWRDLEISANGALIEVQRPFSFIGR
jgi:hypothetical protein